MLESASTQSMKSLNLTTFLFSVLLLLSGCASGPQTTSDTESEPVDEESIQKSPDWFLEPPSEDQMLLSTATATSRSMQIAIDRAKTSARGDIAQQLETRLDQLERQFSEELSQGDQSQLMQQFTQATEAVASQTLVGSRVRERKLAADGNEYRAWVLMEMPIGEARSALLDKINGDEEMRTRMRSTEVFNQLEEKVKNYENTKNK